MIKKITLQFISEKIESDYRSEQQTHIKQEFTLFSIQTVLFFIAYSLYYYETSTFNLTIVVNLFTFMGFILVSKYLIDIHPKWNEYLLPFLQIYFAYIWNIDDIFPTENVNYDYDSYCNYNWFYGFQAFYFHFGIYIFLKAILQLGYQIWPQAIVLAGIYIQYITYYPTHTLEYAAMCITIFLVFVGLILTKYTNEKTKRAQFIDNREKNKWIKIIDEILEQSIVVIKIDEKQDQLVLQQINQLSQIRLRIQNSKDLRVILRDMKIIKLQSNEYQNRNLEQEVRVLVKNEFQRLIPSLEVRSEILHQDYKVKLIQSIVQEEECVILIFENNETNQNRQLKQEIKFRESIFLFLFQQLMTSLIQAKSKLQIIYPLINLQTMRLFLMFKNVPTITEQVSIQKIVQYLQQIYGKEIKFIINVQDQEVEIMFNFFVILVVSLSQLFDTLYHIKFQQKYNLQLRTLKVSLNGTMLNYLHNSKQLKQNHLFTIDFETNKRLIIHKISNILLQSDISVIRKQQLISLILSKNLIWQIFKENKIKLKQKENSLLAKCSFELLI